MAWYRTFFEGLPQTAWKESQSEEYTDWEVDFLADVLELKEGDRVLDVLAGYGRHALPLAERGFELTAVDISEEYCQELQKEAHTAKLPVTVVQGEFDEIKLPETTYAAAYCLGNSFSFFPREKMKSFLRKIGEQIQLGGYFVAHTQLLAESVFPNFQERTWMPVGDDITYLAHNEFDVAEGVIRAELTYTRGSEKVTRSIEQYVYSLAELSALLQEAGLTVIETFGSLDGEPFALGDEQAYILARKSILNE
ncbi:class I SAM-dependent methyltransferase [Persicitalea jodogahamensis]|uniref:Methyltransferase type 11 n=1 Tax=Persicitalea jodogahamensis TaxID=402147 RepID=A0A8J3GA02_9BACT|nr:class I SAM-dependent methyltransferase [Persicitalea jodogahamensis]GHB68603.1 methyltransferase type 11 [Persicitalea jodogahamensis]